MLKFGNDLMSDPNVQYNKLGEFAKRSLRSEWAQQNESLVRELSPYPISYDVSQSQPINFSEYTYTEFLGGIWVATQSLDLNCKFFDDLSRIDSNTDIINVISDYVSDKYLSDDIPEKYKKVRKICFLPGHNMLDVASIEVISRLVCEDDDVYFKPHPITNDDALKLIATTTGWHKIIPREVSGNALLARCDEVYTTSASEISISGTILGKRVFNVSNFFNEGSGVYHPISRVLFLAHKTSVEYAQQKLANIFNSECSGLIFPFHTDIEDRLRHFFSKSIEYKTIYRSLAYPKGNNNKTSVNGKK